MLCRSSIQHVKFQHPFHLPGHPACLHAGSYRVLVEDEELHGLSFEALRRISTHLMVEGQGLHPGRTELWRPRPRICARPCSKTAFPGKPDPLYRTRPPS